MVQATAPLHCALPGIALALIAACGAPITEIGEAGANELVYVSTNTGPIHVLSLDTATGQLSETSRADGGVNPTYMAFSPDRRFAFAIDEANPPDSKVLSFAVDPGDGHLTPINSVETGAVGAPHLAVHPSGKWLAVAHYGRDADDWVGGQVVVIPIGRDGVLAAPSGVTRGPADRPCVNAHQAVFTTRGDYLLVPCLGSDYVAQYRFSGGSLSLNEPPTADVATGAGPRHLALSPDQRHAYLLTELAGTIVWFDYDRAAGLLSQAGTVQAAKTPIAEGGEGWSAHIQVHPNGRFLYVSNRQQSVQRGTENSLGVFRLAAGGEPSALPDAFVTEGVNQPRDFALDPSGQYLISVNQEGERSVQVFRIDRQTGRLTRTQTLVLGDQPAFVHVLGPRG
jgi:6-phosphogluconolactonase